MEYEGTVNRYSDDSCRLRLKVLVMKCKGEFRARAEKESGIRRGGRVRAFAFGGARKNTENVRI